MAAISQPRSRGPGRQFAKGKSGNPTGRPKRTPEMARVEELARAHTDLALRTLAEIAGNPDAPPSARVGAAAALLDRGWGRAPQSVQLGGTGGGPIDITVSFVAARPA